MKDNIIRPSQKRSWGFSGTAEKIILAADKATDAKDIMTTPENNEARGNGGGFPDEDSVTLEYLQGLTKDELFELATHHAIEVDAKPNEKKEVIFDELVDYFEL